MTAALKAECGTPFGGLFAFTGMDHTRGKIICYSFDSGHFQRLK